MEGIRAYIARDKNGELYIYSEKPTMREDGTFIAPGFMFNKEHFSSIKKGEIKECVISTK